MHKKEHNIQGRSVLRLWAILSLSMGMIVFGGCKNNQPIKVGFVGCLTGRLSDLGIAGRNGAMLAIEELNEAGGIHGRQIELIVKDDRHSAEVALKVDRELIDEQVVAIIGHMTSTMSLAVQPLINDAHMVMISPTTSTNALTGLDDYFFRVLPPSRSESQHLAEYLSRTLRVQKVACAYDLANQPFAEEWYRNFTEDFEKTGGTVHFVKPFTSEQNGGYLGIAREILATQPEGIMLVSGALDTAMICQQFYKLGVTIPIIASGWAKTPDLIQHGGSSVEGMIFSQAYDNNSQHPAFLQFKQRYHARFAKKISIGAFYGYESAKLLGLTLRNMSRHDSLKATLLQQQFQGLQGELTIDRYGDAHRQRFITTIQNGQFVTME